MTRRSSRRSDAVDSTVEPWLRVDMGAILVDMGAILEDPLCCAARRGVVCPKASRDELLQEDADAKGHEGDVRPPHPEVDAGRAGHEGGHDRHERARKSA